MIKNVVFDFGQVMFYRFKFWLSWVLLESNMSGFWLNQNFNFLYNHFQFCINFFTIAYIIMSEREVSVAHCLSSSTVTASSFVPKLSALLILLTMNVFK